MPTFPKELADEIIAKDGYYSTDPRCVEVTEYDNHWGGVSYGVTYEGQRNVYTPSDYVNNPRTYWKCKPD